MKINNTELSGWHGQLDTEDVIKHKVLQLGRKHNPHIQTTSEGWESSHVKM